MSRCQSSPREPDEVGERDRDHPGVAAAAEEDVGDSRSFHTQRNWKMAKAASAGTDSGHDQPPEDREVVGAVDLGRLDDRRRQRADVVAQQVGRRAAGRTPVWASQMPRNVPLRSRSGMTWTPPMRRPVRVEPQDRDERHLQRHDHEADHEHEHHVAAPELHPREGVGGEGRDGDRDDRRRDGHREAVQEGVLEAAGVERLAVVLEGPLAGPERVGEGGPPAGACRRAPRAGTT